MATADASREARSWLATREQERAAAGNSRRQRREQRAATEGENSESERASGSGSRNAGAGDDSFLKWLTGNPLYWAFIAIFMVLILVSCLSFVGDYFARRNIAMLKELDGLQSASRTQPTATSASPSIFAPEAPLQVLEDIKDGSEVSLSARTRIVLRGPMSVTFVNSAQLIKGFSGDFKLYVEDTGHRAWTSGFSSKPTPMSVNDFLSLIRQRQAGTRVRIFINSGVVEINT